MSADLRSASRSDALKTSTGGGAAAPAKEASPVTEVSKEEKDPSVVVFRDTLYTITLSEALDRGFAVDSDIWKLEGEDTTSATAITSNRGKLITNDFFESAEEINDWLRKRGKIRLDLSIKITASKGYGVFATKPIPKNVFLGFYEGTYRKSKYQVGNSIYCFSISDDYTIDALNMNFSNWTRFVNDGRRKNIGARQSEKGAPIEFWSIEDIAEGEELIYSYGETYWKVMTKKGMSFIDR